MKAMMHPKALVALALVAGGLGMGAPV